MNVRDIAIKEIIEVAEWFKHYTGTKLPIDTLGEFGFIAHEGDENLAAAFFFPVVGANWGIIAWPVGNPNVDKKLRGEGLDAVIDYAHGYAQALGYKYVSTWASHKTIEDRFHKHGYHVGDANVNQMIKFLGVMNG